jgi:hypothetical protein
MTVYDVRGSDVITLTDKDQMNTIRTYNDTSMKPIMEEVEEENLHSQGSNLMMASQS